MNYTLYCLEFINGVHFGRGNLDSSEITFHADTLFSALFQEALKMKKQDRFLKQVSDGKIIFSDAFPYIGKIYYIPKPMITVQTEDESKQGDSRQKKKFKNLKYIPVSTLTGTGLYVLAGYENESDRELLDELFESLQYTGIGGKKSSGLGRFVYKVCKVPEDMMGYLRKKSEKNILLSTALPEDEELEQVMKDSSYFLIKRSGFVDSSEYALQQMRKRDLYVFSSGSCFAHTFRGRIIEERNGGKHPVFRYAKAFFMGV